MSADAAAEVSLDASTGPGAARAAALARRAAKEFGASLGLALAADVAPRPGATPGRRSYVTLATAAGEELARYDRLDTTAPAIIRRRAVLYALNLTREHLLDRLAP